ncbi:MAG: hypothetical protein IT368_09985 [Candidatus Hydrogenedentes bacterium]|nr:hypothetical protein [Candidatus Hydrogenedentota bacterium]
MIQYSAEDLAEARQALVQQWGVQAQRVDKGTLDWEILVEALAERIEWLFKHDYNRLLTAVYILDISEARYKAALDQPGMTERARDLAEAILDRETQKIISRRRYAQQPPAQLDE